jgi:hypothetical protein
MKNVKTLDLEHFKESPSLAQQKQATEALESGNVLLFPNLPFELKAEEIPFLSTSALAPKRKNISYDCRIDQLKGDVFSDQKHQQLQAMIRRFAEYTRALVVNLFPQYREQLEQARTSYRVMQAKGRDSLSSNKDDRRLHVDAFPSTPTQGKRILRVFSNINPNHEPRVWRVGDDFEQVAERFLPQLKARSWLKRQMLRSAKITKGTRSKYDSLMLQLHDQMKQDANYQEGGWSEEVQLPAGSTWMVFTDQAPHAVISGQFCLEQTFHFPVEAMAFAERSPLRVLERLVGKQLA